jgi:hypothetical protein
MPRKRVAKKSVDLATDKAGDGHMSLVDEGLTISAIR